VSGASSSESAESLLARGIQTYNTQWSDEAMALSHKVLHRAPAHLQADCIISGAHL
jgi:hypothetical protein